MYYRRRLGLILIVMLALQPVAFVVCQVKCRARSTAAMETSASADARIGCHEHASAMPDDTGVSTRSLTAIHRCLHQPIPFVKRIIEKIERPASLVVTGSIARLDIGTRAATFSHPSNHAPPGPPIQRSDVLRL